MDTPDVAGGQESTESDVGPIEEEADDDEGYPFLSEPVGAIRVSPYAVAAFVVSMLGMWQVRSAEFIFYGGPLRQIIGFVIPAGVAIIALWLVGRAEEEIFFAEGQLGGVGFCRAARVIALVTIAFVVAATLYLTVWGIHRGRLEF